MVGLWGMDNKKEMMTQISDLDSCMTSGDISLHRQELISVYLKGRG